jgi:pyruvate-ferredoxin/flavodoxin oxidoreductase
MSRTPEAASARPALITVDGNEAVARVAHRLSEVIAIYPITPSSAMGELSDDWSSQGQRNLWGQVPRVVVMQSEGGAAGAVHGALLSGALATTFTASQGLLLMIPNLYKIAGELLPFVVHVAARTVATHALSIFGDHSDVMACQRTGCALLASGSVQEAQDLAAVAHAATLEARVPFLHFFDGFRTSHELDRIAPLSDADLVALIPEARVLEHRARGLSPDHPVLHGAAQNPDTFFQAREACQPFHAGCPAVVQDTMDRLGQLTGRSYRLFDYVGDADAERVVVQMGSGCETTEATVEHLRARGEKVGLVKVRLYRPFSVEAFAAALPRSTRAIAVLDRSKDPGAPGEGLYQDVVTALDEARGTGVLPGEFRPVVVGGRYGLSSKEYTPAMARAVLDELRRDAPRRHFTVGIRDDVTGSSLRFDESFDIEADDVTRAVFFGLGADGTVGANKNSIKILTEEADLQAQGYFVYDSKKSGAVTVSHLRFSPRPIRAPYLIRQGSFVACHHWTLLQRLDVLACAAPGATVLLNCPYEPAAVWDHLDREVQEQLVAKKLRLFVIDADRLASELGMRGRINTLMQTCFFAISGVLPRQRALDAIKHAIEKTYARKGDEVVQQNREAVDQALAHLHEVPVPAAPTATERRHPPVPADAPDFVQRVTAAMLAGHGDQLPVSVFAADGAWPTGTSRWEKRNIASEIPAWEPGLCIQCNKCVLVCPHAALRAKIYQPARLDHAPPSFPSLDGKGDWAGQKYSLQVAPEDCTGCRLCVEVCPAHSHADPEHRALAMVPKTEVLETERHHNEFFLGLPEVDRATVKRDVKGSQLLLPLFEYSGACAGCGETPYLKLLTQLYGDRLVVANATGCSSIYGGNLPTTPYARDRAGRGPAWANSLFEDNAEFGLGIRMGLDHHRGEALELLGTLADRVPAELAAQLAAGSAVSCGDEAGLARQRERVEELRRVLQAGLGDGAAGDALLQGRMRRLLEMADHLVPKTVWIVGGDGWAYDIGYGGLDHVLASGENLNILVLDTEVYSNTGGQQSKATPLGAVARFAAGGKSRPKKDLGLLAMTYGNVYVAQVALEAKDAHTGRVLGEAESYPGPSLVIAFSPCIAHGYDLAGSGAQERHAVRSGYWPLYRFDPRRAAAHQSPLQLDSSFPSEDLGEYMHGESRFRSVEQQDPERYAHLLEQARHQVAERYRLYQRLAQPPDTSSDSGP